MPSHPYDPTPVTRRVVITHDIVDRVTGVTLEADPGEQLPDVDLSAWAGAFTVETSMAGDEREVVLRFPDCAAEHVPVIERRRICTPGGGSVTSRRAFQGEDHSDETKAKSATAPTPIDPADIRPGDEFRVIYQATCERVDESAECIVTTTNVYWDRAGDPHATYHLVHRPDPDAEAVQAIRSASYNIHHAGERMDPLPGLPEATDLLTKLREQGWDVVRRAES